MENATTAIFPGMATAAVRITSLGSTTALITAYSALGENVRYSANTIEEMQKLLLGYRDNMRVEVENGIPVTAKTVADLRAVSTWPEV